MDLELLKTFIEVSHTKHFGKAADNLFLTQSAVSARIRLLESKLDCQLFQRNTKQVYLTREGESFVTHAQNILNAWASAKQQIASGAPGDPPLSITSHHQLWQLLFNHRLGALELPLITQTLPAAEAWQALENHQTDILLTYKAGQHNGFTQHPLGQLALVLAASHSSAAQFHWQQTGYIHIDWGIAFDQFQQRHIQDKLPRIMHSDDTGNVVPLLLQHNACAYLPQTLVEQHPQLTALKHNKAPTFKQTICALYASHSPRKTRIQQTLSQLSF